MVNDKTMERYDIDKLRSLPCEGVAQRLGMKVQHHKALCPFHNDHTPSMTFKGSKFRCWSCGASGNAIDLVMRHLNLDFKTACRWLADEHNVIVSDISPSAFRPQPSTFNASRYEKYFEHPWLNDEARRFLFEERRLDERVARWCRLTSWKDKQGVPWLQIPYYDREGRLVGVQNRNLKPLSGSPQKGEGSAPRFRFPRGAECGIYNLPVLNRLQPGDTLFITEGCSDCWAMLSAGHKAIAIPSATLLTKKDIDLLKGLSLGASPFGEDGGAVEAGRGLRFAMYPDRDAPGERLFLQLKEVLPSLEHHQLPPDCKDFSDYYIKRLVVRG